MARSPTRRLAVVVALAAVASAAVWGLARGRRGSDPTRAAERALDAGDVVEAGTILRRLSREDPLQPRVHLLRARLLRLRGRSRDADVALGRARDLGAPEADTWREYGLLVAGSDFPRAEAILRRALRDRPADVEVLRALADGLSGRERWAEAVEFYSRWLAVEPGRGDAVRGRAWALVNAGRAPEAVAELRSALGREPDDYETRLLLADCFLFFGNAREAEPELAACRRLHPERPQPLIGLAGCAVTRGDPDRAQTLLDQAVALDPSSVTALTYRGNLAMRRHRRDLAVADFRRVLAIDPGNRQAHLKLAHLYRHAGDAPRARSHARAFDSPERPEPCRSRPSP